MLRGRRGGRKVVKLGPCEATKMAAVPRLPRCGATRRQEAPTLNGEENKLASKDAVVKSREASGKADACE